MEDIEVQQPYYKRAKFTDYAMKYTVYNVFYLCILLYFYIYIFTMVASCSISGCVKRIQTINICLK